MSECWWTATLTADQLQTLLTPPREAAPFAILERLTGMDFPALEETIDISLWSKGCVFGDAYELRWERRSTQYQAWLLGSVTLPGFETELPMSAQSEDTAGFMWGPDTPRIARRPQYRSLEGNTKGRPILYRREFRRADGALVVYRLTGMKWEA
jgi:hypothetical protein